MLEFCDWLLKTLETSKYNSTGVSKFVSQAIAIDFITPKILDQQRLAC